VAGAAARALTARLGFDLEDLLGRGTGDPAVGIHRIEAEFMPQCEYVSVPSKAIAHVVESDHSVTPTVLYNSFPTTLRSKISRRPDLRSRPVRLTWIGQTIGPGRGLETVVDALSLLPANCELGLRGWVSNLYKAELEARASKAHATSRLRFLDPVLHDDIVGAAAWGDIGVASEVEGSTNGALTVSNKLFLYFSAGLAIAATETVGQLEALTTTSRSAVTYRSDQSERLAAELAPWMADRDALEDAQMEAWNLGSDTMSWDVEQERFLALVEVE
jgi:hypothetical protein